MPVPDTALPSWGTSSLIIMHGQWIWSGGNIIQELLAIFACLGEESEFAQPVSDAYIKATDGCVVVQAVAFCPCVQRPPDSKNARASFFSVASAMKCPLITRRLPTSARKTPFPRKLVAQVWRAVPGALGFGVGGHHVWAGSGILVSGPAICRSVLAPYRSANDSDISVEFLIAASSLTSSRVASDQKKSN
ncbi:uncharacterized protein ATNIH1004_000986 [Aspergillus tanneri]|uniref:Uncharacterized protein n=1 Tax=Aspergillus tanneri TaxID=1220188 RepID=A0A5M9MY94_9EURO|nr:uncharacterized protein ATNIH1004_000986 [Aspergillus tanneri]KAA8652082.1 hypothetical protein ATNIH1004_000986 [Aspergillus tanneri]